jgi:hypothetical protein
MKKVLLAAMAAFMLFSAAACSSGGAAADFDKPWGTPQTAYEKCEYTVEIFERVPVKDSKGKIIKYEDGERLAEGKMDQTLMAKGEGSKNEALVNTNYTVKWIESEKAGENSDKEDTVISSVSFLTETLAPQTASKTVSLESRTVNEKHQNYSYEFSSDYRTGSKKSKILFGKNENGEYDADYTAESGEGKGDDKYVPADKDGNGKIETEYKEFSTGGSYDNEQLFYLVRAFKNFGGGAQNSFTLNSVYDRYRYSLEGKKFSPFPMVAAADGSKSKIETGELIFGILDGREESFATLYGEFKTMVAESADSAFKAYMQICFNEMEAERDKEILKDMQEVLDTIKTGDSKQDEKTTAMQDKLNALANIYTVDCYGTSVVINLDQSGPAHRFFISDPGLKFGDTSLKTNKIIFRYEYMLYNRDTKAEQFRYVYNLSGYSVI